MCFFFMFLSHYIYFFLLLKNKIQWKPNTVFTERATVVNSVCLSTDLVSYSTLLYARVQVLFSLRVNAGARAHTQSAAEIINNHVLRAAI